jgi:hypothetical protein
MKFGPVKLDQAEGKILAHHIARPGGGQAFRKGKPLKAEDITALRALGRQQVYVAELEAGDIDEDSAAVRIAAAVSGRDLAATRPHAGRVNLQANCLGILRVAAEALYRVNELEGVTIATLTTYTVARPRQTVATVKIIPYAIAESLVQAAERLGREREPILELLSLQARQVHLILTGAPENQPRVRATFEAPLRARIAGLGSELSSVDFISIDEADLGEAGLMKALQKAAVSGAGLIVLAGETAIMDRRDRAPRAVERLGGVVTCYGAPVDPGNLLMLAYLDEVPVLGAPGCARSLKPNVIDWILPRLLAGERLSRKDIISFGHGGLLESSPEGRFWRSDLDSPEGA